MAPRKKNIETELKETESKKRATRKTTKKSAENADTSLSVPAEPEIVDGLENNSTKTNDASQANPGRFTAEMLIAMGQQLAEEESAKTSVEASNDECEEFDESFDSVEIFAEVEDEVDFEVEESNDNDAPIAEHSAEIVGQVFKYKEMNFIALEEADGGVLAISSNILERKMRFADSADKGSNDWKKSSLRKKLNNEYIGKFDKNDLIPIVSDLTADTGEDDYGKCEDYIAIPSDNMFRKFHKIIPVYHGWVWSLTPWAISYGTLSAVGARTSAKTIYSEQVNRELGVAIVCKFKRDVVGI